MFIPDRMSIRRFACLLVAGVGLIVQGDIGIAHSLDRAGLCAPVRPAWAIACKEASGLATNKSGASDDPFSQADLVAPEDLAKLLSLNQKPLVLQVGFQPLYKIGHIPGSIYAGPAREGAGIDKLKEAVENLARDQAVVIYCGCCPFKDCPNIKPAFDALKSMGFTKVKVLNLPDNFTQDWVNKGYPTDKGAHPAQQ